MSYTPIKSRVLLVVIHLCCFWSWQVLQDINTLADSAGHQHATFCDLQDNPGLYVPILQMRKPRKFEILSPSNRDYIAEEGIEAGLVMTSNN